MGDGAIFYAHCDIKIEEGSLIGNWGKYGGGVYTQGSVSNFVNLRILGNEANATADSSGGFAYFSTGSTGSNFFNCVISGNKSLGRNGVFDLSE